jgi:cytochrome c-type biogenesis protein
MVRTRLLRSTLLFVAGFTVVFAAFEATASSLGHLLQHHQVVLDRIAGVLIILMGLVFAGVLAPALLQQERRLHVRPSQLGSWAPPIMGMAFAFGWTPCIGPALGAVIALASDQSTLLRGELLLVFYSLGLGLPFVIAGVAFGRVTVVMSWARRNARIINLIAGIVLVVFGVILLTDSVHRLSTVFSDLLDWLGLHRLTTSI